MLSTYSTLSKKDLVTLRAERLNFLECEHVRGMLMLEENSNDPEARQTLTDLERRIALHRRTLAQTVTPAPDEGTPAENPPDDEGSDAVSPR